MTAMGINGYTSIGGGETAFPTTHWTAIQKVRSEDNTEGQFVVGELLKDYWKPVYCYLRRKGYGNEDAKDLTQGFFQEVVLGRELIQQADPAKGRFRTLLLTALDRYLASTVRWQKAHKRIPSGRLFSLEQVDTRELPEVETLSTCEESFNYAWAADLLDRTLEEVETDCCQRGMETHWNLFRDRVLRPILEDKTPPPLAELCARYRIDEPTKASNMIFAVKRRLQNALTRCVRESVAADEEVCEEMLALARFLTRR